MTIKKALNTMLSVILKNNLILITVYFSFFPHKITKLEIKNTSLRENKNFELSSSDITCFKYNSIIISRY